MLVGDIVRRNARRFASKTAVIHEEAELSWAALDDRANRLATYLLARGLDPGDRVALAARNCLQWPEMTFGLAKAGLVLVPVNVRQTASETAFMLDDAGCRAAIVHSDQVEGLGEAMAGLDVR